MNTVRGNTHRLLLSKFGIKRKNKTLILVYHLAVLYSILSGEVYFISNHLVPFCFVSFDLI